jgi:hypothetical protein
MSWYGEPAIIRHAETPSPQSKGRSNMANTKSSYRKQVVAEIDAVPVEYLPLLLQMIRTYRQSVDLKPAAESFRKGWQETKAGETIPLKHLWEGVHDE